MYKSFMTVAFTVIFGLTTVITSASMLTITDMDMHPSDWGVISKFNSVTIAAGQPIANKPSLTVSTSGQLWAAIYKTSPVWNPNLLGEITTIEASADFVINSGITFSPVLVQGNNVYAPPGIPPYFIEPQNFGVPQGLSWNLPISLFGREVGNGPDRPDFAAGAAPIAFAIAARRDPSFGGTYRFGNVQFKITGRLPGDFNGNDTVNAADYVMWRKNDGRQGGYDSWRTNFGRTVPAAGADISSTIPEPTVFTFLVLTAASGIFWRIHASE